MDLQRLGKNLNGYFGETINIAGVLHDCRSAALQHGWEAEEMLAAPGRVLSAFKRTAAGCGLGANERKDAETSEGISGGHTKEQRHSKEFRIYISTGIHGDEPAGPLAARALLQQDLLPRNLSLWLLPCLNPTGFMLNRRENADGLDLNREYLNPKAPETRAHIDWLSRQPSFDLSLCLHEDWESHGFYVYELNLDNRPSLAEKIVEAVAKVCPIDRSEVIEGRPASAGIIRPSTDPRSRPQWPEAFYLVSHKSRLSYTLEAPSDFLLSARVAALTEGVQAALRAFGRGPNGSAQHACP